MRLTLDPDFSSGHWPGPLAGADAVVGEEWVSPRRFVNLLLAAFGLPAEGGSRAERAARLVPAVKALPGFWSASAEADPLGTARRLLEWRDQLAMAGWDGTGTEPRLRALGDLARSATPGMPDHLRWIEEAAATRSSGLTELRLLVPRTDFEPLWQRVFAALERTGTRVVEHTIPIAPAHGDLAAARAKDFQPTGDGSLVVLRSTGPLQAADEVAAWLAERGDATFGRTVFVGGDPVLDAALVRHGLPPLGQPYEQPDDAMFQLLPLVLEMLWSPQDPQRAFELLLLHPSIVPGDAAVPLRAALREWPAVGSDAWEDALRVALAGIDEPAARERIAARMSLLWTPVATRDQGAPREDVLARVDMLRAWLQGRLEAQEGPVSMTGALRQCRVFRRLLLASGQEVFGEPQLRRFVAEATRSLSGAPTHEAAAGYAVVGAPGAIAGPAECVVWWGFDPTGVAGYQRLPLTIAERAELVAAGVHLPDPARLAARHAASWQRPLHQTTGTLLLICLQVADPHEDVHAHPLWDEIATRVDGSGHARAKAMERLVRDTLVPHDRRVARTALAEPQPVHEWALPEDLRERREYESPSSVETLLGCPLKWVLDHVAQLRSFESPSVADADSAQLLGNLLHELLDRLFDAGVPAPDQATRLAEALFERDAPRLAAPLWLPGNEPQREEARSKFVKTALRLSQLLQRTNTTIVASEQTYEGSAFGTRFLGKPDLVLASPYRVLDLKWGGATYRRNSLHRGTAFQLAAYAYLTQDGPVFPGVAYFIMGAQRMFTTSPQSFPNAEAVVGPPPEETWALYQRAHADRWREVETGMVRALGIAKDGERIPTETRVDDGVLVVEPPCGFCDYATLCGRAFAKGEA